MAQVDHSGLQDTEMQGNETEPLLACSCGDGSMSNRGVLTPRGTTWISEDVPLEEPSGAFGAACGRGSRAAVWSLAALAGFAGILYCLCTIATTAVASPSDAAHGHRVGGGEDSIGSAAPGAAAASVAVVPAEGDLASRRGGAFRAVIHNTIMRANPGSDVGGVTTPAWPPRSSTTSTTTFTTTGPSTTTRGSSTSSSSSSSPSSSSSTATSTTPPPTTVTTTKKTLTETSRGEEVTSSPQASSSRSNDRDQHQQRHHGSKPPPKEEEHRPAAPVAGPQEVTFYVYRAQSVANYPLENVDAADLAGVLWYLHHEVIPATPRKYHIDRIRRHKIRYKPTQEFWNVHHASFGPFFAYDGGRCTTPEGGKLYHQYGFLIGCQFVTLSEGAYMSDKPTTVACKPGSDQCRSPLWYSLPGPCPTKGLQQQDLKGNSETLDVSKGKDPECVRRMPGGRCRGGGPPTGAPDCTYSVEQAGEILLDELAGIEDYNEFWNTSYYKCQQDKMRGKVSGPCIRNREYDGELDRGIGNTFWNGKFDKDRCHARMEKARALFRKHYPDFPDLETPLCDFDMIYKDEFTWPANHTGGVSSSWWDMRM